MGTPPASPHPSVCSPALSPNPLLATCFTQDAVLKVELLEEFRKAPPDVCDMRSVQSSREGSRRSPTDTPRLGAVKVKVAQSCQTCLRPHRLYCPWSSPGQNMEWGAVPLSGDLPDPGIEPRSLALQADSLPAEPPGKPNHRNKARVLQSQWCALFGSQRSEKLRLRYTVVY